MDKNCVSAGKAYFWIVTKKCHSYSKGFFNKVFSRLIHPFGTAEKIAPNELKRSAVLPITIKKWNFILWSVLSCTVKTLVGDKQRFIFENFLTVHFKN